MNRQNEIENVIKTVISQFGNTMENVQSKSRTTEIVMLRGLLCYILRLYGLVYTKIGERLGGIHYSTVIYHIQKMDGLVNIYYNPVSQYERDIIKTAREYRAKHNENL